MMPKTEKELELYFKLQELNTQRLIRHVKPYGNGSQNYKEDYNEVLYKKMESEYLKLANE